MKGFMVGVLALAMVATSAATANAASPKATVYTFQVVSDEGGKSNVSGTVRLQPTGNGNTVIHVSAKGLQANGHYVLTWSTSTDCTTAASTIVEFTVKGNGMLEMTKSLSTDITSISSIGLRADTAAGTLVACASGS